ncbi:hypothetical protein V8F33_012383 [Rhypophila sp. PSN 637]
MCSSTDSVESNKSPMPRPLKGLQQTPSYKPISFAFDRAAVMFWFNRRQFHADLAPKNGTTIEKDIFLTIERTGREEINTSYHESTSQYRNLTQQFTASHETTRTGTSSTTSLHIRQTNSTSRTTSSTDMASSPPSIDSEILWKRDYYDDKRWQGASKRKKGNENSEPNDELGGRPELSGNGVGPARVELAGHEMQEMPVSMDVGELEGSAVAVELDGSQGLGEITAPGVDARIKSNDGEKLTLDGETSPGPRAEVGTISDPEHDDGHVSSPLGSPI